MSITRNDVHRPVELIPEDYKEVGYYVLAGQDAPAYYALSPQPAGQNRNWGGPYGAELNRCDHCGSATLRYGIELVHLPSGAHIHVGEICAGNRFARSSAAFQQLRADAALDRKAHAVKLKRDEFLAGNPRLAVVWRTPGSNQFVNDVVNKLRRYGSLSTAQSKALERAWKRERFSGLRAVAPTVAAPVGRCAVSGVIISAKVKETDYGPVQKMTVLDDRGFRVHVTCPREVSDYASKVMWGPMTASGKPRQEMTIIEALRGKRIEFAASLAPTDDDPSFAWAKRPTKVNFEQAA